MFSSHNKEKNIANTKNQRKCIILQAFFSHFILIVLAGQHIFIQYLNLVLWHGIESDYFYKEHTI